MYSVGALRLAPAPSAPKLSEDADGSYRGSEAHKPLYENFPAARRAPPPRLAGAAPTLHGLTPGTTCFQVTAIAAAHADGCGIGLADTVSTPTKPFALPVTYDMTAGTLKIGTDGSLGVGTISPATSM